MPTRRAGRCSTRSKGKVGHRWYLWVFKSHSVVYFVLDPSRSAKVPRPTLAGVSAASSVVDRYGAYKQVRPATPRGGLAFCWAHQRRDLLALANDHPDLSGLGHGLGRADRAAVPAAWAAPPGPTTTPRPSRVIDSEPSCASSPCDGMANAAQPAWAMSNWRRLRARCCAACSTHWPGLTRVPGPSLAGPWTTMPSERALRPAVVARKNFYGSGSQWSGQLAATMYSLLMTLRLWELNPRTWLSAYLQACASIGSRAPAGHRPASCPGPWMPRSWRPCARATGDIATRSRQLMNTLLRARVQRQTICRRSRALIEQTPSSSARRCRAWLCELFDWRQPEWRLQDMTCRVALLRMQADGLITLPASQMPRAAPPGPLPATPATDAQPRCPQPVHELPALTLRLVDRRGRIAAVERVHRALPLPGLHAHVWQPDPLQRLRRRAAGRLLSFGASAWKLAAREQLHRLERRAAPTEPATRRQQRALPDPALDPVQRAGLQDPRHGRAAVCPRIGWPATAIGPCCWRPSSRSAPPRHLLQGRQLVNVGRTTGRGKKCTATSRPPHQGHLALPAAQELPCRAVPLGTARRDYRMFTNFDTPRDVSP